MLSYLRKSMVAYVYELFIFVLFFFTLMFVFFGFSNCTWPFICEHVIIILRRWWLFFAFLWFVTKIFIHLLKVCFFLSFFYFFNKSSCNQCSNVWVIFCPFIFLFLTFQLYFCLFLFIIFLIFLLIFLFVFLVYFHTLNFMLFLSFMPIVLL